MSENEIENGNEKKSKNIFLRIIPLYGWICLILMATLNIITFIGTRFVNKNFVHYDFTLSIDNAIPFIKEFIVVYIIFAYLQWIYGYYLSAKTDKPECIRIFSAEIIAKLICLICFMVIPTTMQRADVQGTDFFSKSVKIVYGIDSADNLFPSIHCLESYLLARTLPLLKKAPRWYKIITWPVSILVFASVLFVKQHVIVDVVSAIAAVEIGLFLSKIIFRSKKD